MRTIALTRGKAGEDVSMVEVRNWTRALQGEAYLWAIDKLCGGPVGRQPWLR